MCDNFDNFQRVEVTHVIKVEIVISMTPIIHAANAPRQQREFIVKFPNRVTLSNAKIMENACRAANAVVQMVGRDISVKLQQINFRCLVLMARAT